MLTIPVDDDLKLRQLQKADAVTLFELIDANRAHLRQWLPWLDITRSWRDSEAFIEDTAAKCVRGEGLVCGIWQAVQLTGLVSFNGIDSMNRKAEIGYWLSDNCQGRGIMTKACKALMRYGYEQLGLNRITIRCGRENHRSRAIPKRLGMTLEGIERQGEYLYDHFSDLEVYRLLRQEFYGPGARE